MEISISPSPRKSLHPTPIRCSLELTSLSLNVYKLAQPPPNTLLFHIFLILKLHWTEVYRRRHVVLVRPLRKGRHNASLTGFSTTWVAPGTHGLDRGMIEQGIVARVAEVEERPESRQVTPGTGAFHNGLSTGIGKLPRLPLVFEGKGQHGSRARGSR